MGLFLWRRLLGKPDGTFIRLRCWALGHRWWLCVEECCGAEREWCGWCLGVRRPSPVTGRDRPMP